MPRATLPDHHAPGGGFRNPWPNAGQPVFTGMLRWAMTRTVKPRIDRTKRGQFPKAQPSFASPRADPTEVSLTWVGHATFLIQIAGLNVLRVMRENDLLAIVKQRVRTTQSNHEYGRYPNLVQDVVIIRPDQVWCADITYIRLRRQFVYLAIILDLFTRGFGSIRRGNHVEHNQRRDKQ